MSDTHQQLHQGQIAGYRYRSVGQIEAQQSWQRHPPRGSNVFRPGVALVPQKVVHHGSLYRECRGDEIGQMESAHEDE
jgi:hypothetical protein